MSSAGSNLRHRSASPSSPSAARSVADSPLGRAHLPVKKLESCIDGNSDDDQSQDLSSAGSKLYQYMTQNSNHALIPLKFIAQAGVCQGITRAKSNEAGSNRVLETRVHRAASHDATTNLYPQARSFLSLKLFDIIKKNADGYESSLGNVVCRLFTLATEPGYPTGSNARVFGIRRKIQFPTVTAPSVILTMILKLYF